MAKRIINFSEALNNVLTGKTRYLIRAKWIITTADNFILLDHSKYIILDEPIDASKLECFLMCSNGFQEEAQFSSSEVLAQDWLDLSEWVLIKNRNDLDRRQLVN